MESVHYNKKKPKYIYFLFLFWIIKSREKKIFFSGSICIKQETIKYKTKKKANSVIFFLANLLLFFFLTRIFALKTF